MLSTFTLNLEVYNSDYSLFRIPLGHFSKVAESKRCGIKLLHLSVALAECIPVIGQLGALCERVIVIKQVRKQEKKQERKIVEFVKSSYRDAIRGGAFNLDSQDRTYLRIQPEFKRVRDKIKKSSSPLYTSEILRKIKELASCPELIEAREALRMGIQPEKLCSGVSGSYILLSRKGKRLGIFKPSEQEPGMPNNILKSKFKNGLYGIPPGTGYLRERIAYLLDKKTHFSGVPLTKIVQFEKHYFPYIDWMKKKNFLVGSFQKWVTGSHEALSSFSRSKLKIKIPVGEIHKLAIFDIRMLNCDRHLKNFLVDDNGTKTYPIDHGSICPGDAKDLRFGWMGFPQAKKTFSKEALDYIERIDLEADRALIKRKIPGISSDILAMLYISGCLLKIAAKKGLTAYQIGDLLIDGGPSSYFAITIWPTIEYSPSLNINDFLTREVDLYLSANR